MPITVETYERVALEDSDTKWELVCGRLKAKPDMTTEHSEIARNLVRQSVLQLPVNAFAVDKEGPMLQVPNGNYRVPDVCVIARGSIEKRLADLPARLEVYADAMPLVVEVWSPSTGDVNIDEKLREYQLRGDLEIWRIHPYERTLTTWRRQPDGSYTEAIYRDGVVRPASLPGVAIDLAVLFA